MLKATVLHQRLPRIGWTVKPHMFIWTWSVLRLSRQLLESRRHFVVARYVSRKDGLLFLLQLFLYQRLLSQTEFKLFLRTTINERATFRNLVHG